MAKVYITSGTSWAGVATNGGNITVECIGGGGGGGGNQATEAAACAGGGGGAYASKSVAYTSGSTISGIQIGQGGAGGTDANPRNGTETYWNTNVVKAWFGGGGGSTSNYGAGGSTDNSTGTTKYTGGTGGGGGASFYGGGGGGGAAGPNGAGNNGSDYSTSTGGTGGQGDVTYGGTGGDANNDGNAGQEWDSTHGCGGGGGGGSYPNHVGGQGGNYGAGGGGGCGGGMAGGKAGGAGTQGLIVITYTPALDYWEYTQNFDSLTDGDINGQDSWVSTGTTNFVVQTSVKAQGAKALAIISGVGYSASRMITPMTKGTMHISARSTVNTDNAPNIRLTDSGGSTMCQILTLSGYWAWQYGGSNHNIATYSANTWYDIVIDFDFSTYKYRVSIDNGANFTGWNAFITASKLDIGKIVFFQPDGAGTTTAYYDDIRQYSFTQTIVMDTTVGEYIVTGIDNIFNKVLSIMTSVGDYILTGINISINKGYQIITNVSSFIIGSNNIIIKKTFEFIVQNGEYLLSGINIATKKVLNLIIEKGNFILNGINILFRGRGDWIWTRETKHSTNWTLNSKNTTSWNLSTKNTTNWVNKTKS